VGLMVVDGEELLEEDASQTNHLFLKGGEASLLRLDQVQYHDHNM